MQPINYACFAAALAGIIIGIIEIRNKKLVGSRRRNKLYSERSIKKFAPNEGLLLILGSLGIVLMGSDVNKGWPYWTGFGVVLFTIFADWLLAKKQLVRKEEEVKMPRRLDGKVDCLSKSLLLHDDTTKIQI